MSKCISQHGEYSEHELESDYCKLCGVFDEDAVIAERDALAAVIERVRAFVSNESYQGDDGVVGGAEVLSLLDEAPAVSLAEHDAQVLEAAAGRILLARRGNALGQPDAKLVDPNGDASVWLFNEAARLREGAGDRG